MEAKTLMLGDADLSEYITAPLEGNEKYLNSIKKKIKKLKKRDISHEKRIVEMLENTYLDNIYPAIDLSFLSMSNKLEGIDISVPRFSVYRFNGKNEFSIRFSNIYSYLDADLSYKSYLTVNLNSGSKSYSGVILNNFAKLFENQGFTLESITRYDKDDKISLLGKRKEVKKYKVGSKKDLQITSKFNGIIPDSTIEKVKEAEKDFDDIYIIAETKPKQWNIEYIETDPIVTGIKNNKASFISSFDTTPLEDLVKNNFIKSKGN